jgi:hypothetical protein
LQVKFNAQDRTFEVTDTQAGPILRQGVILSKAGGRRVLKAEVDEVDGRKELVLRLGEAWSVRVRVPDDGQVELRTEGRPDGPVGFRARAVMGRRPMVALLADQQPEDRGVLVTRCGPAEVAGARSLLDPRRDLAVTATSPGRANWRHEDGWQLQAEAPGGGLLLKLEIQRHYYRDRLGIEYFAPIRKQRRWPTAPVVAMTWYGIEGWKGQPAQRKEWLYPNIDWVAEHLLPYAGDNLVFQLDDNYAFDDDGYMRELSDYIR